MAIFHLTAKIISRAKDQSVIASAAYRSGQKLIDLSTGAVKQYPNRKERICFTAIYAPKDAPSWARDRNQLWNIVEQVEARKNSTFAREIEVALPAELTHEQHILLITDFVRQNIVRYNLVADVAIHRPDRHSDQRNEHCHILFPERAIGADGFARLKDRRLQKRETLRRWRAQWAHLCNRTLARHGHTVSIDHRTLSAQGITRLPGIHLGYVAAAIEKRDGASERGKRLRAIKARNTAREITKERTTNDSDRRSDPKRNSPNSIASREAVPIAESRSSASGPYSNPGSSIDRFGDRDPKSDYSNRRASNRNVATFKSTVGAQLRLGLYRYAPSFAATRYITAELAKRKPIEDRVSIPGDQTDLWGVGRLPRPRG